MKLYIKDTIRRLRTAKGMTPEQLADALGVAFQSVSRWENGTNYPDVELIPEIAIYFGVSTDELLGMSGAIKAEKLGAGEILLTSMDADGTKAGYDLELTKAIASSVNIPVIASGGAGRMEHFKDAFEKGGADAVLAASLFHYREITISELKEYLKNEGIPVRI